MAYGHDTDIILCTTCDAEFTIARFDDEEGENPEFCPFCGSPLWSEEEDDDEDDDDSYD